MDKGQIFLRFLKNEGVYPEFVKCFIKFNPKRNYIEYAKNTHPSSFVGGAFIWESKSIDWGSISMKWIKKLKNSIS